MRLIQFLIAIHGRIHFVKQNQTHDYYQFHFVFPIFTKK